MNPATSPEPADFSTKTEKLNPTSTRSKFVKVLITVVRVVFGSWKIGGVLDFYKSTFVSLVIKVRIISSVVSFITNLNVNILVVSHVVALSLLRLLVMDTLSEVLKYLNELKNMLDDGDSTMKEKVLEEVKHEVVVFIKAPFREYYEPFMRFSTPCGVEDYVNKGEPSIVFGRNFLVAIKSQVDFGLGEMRIDIMMLKEDRDVDTLLANLVKDMVEDGKMGSGIVKMSKANRIKRYNVNKLTPPTLPKIEEISPPLSSTPQPIFCPLSPKQKEKILEALDRKYKELEDEKLILEVLVNYMVYRNKLDEVLMGRARLENKDYMEEEKEIIVENGLPQKLSDMGKFVLPVRVNATTHLSSLVDTGASVSVLPYSLYNNIGLGNPQPYHSNITMADNTQAKAMGKVSNALIQIGYQAYLAGFLVLDIPVDRELPFLLGRPFIRTRGALIDISRGTMTINDGVIKHTYYPKSRAKAYLESFEMDEDEDWLSCFEVGRDEEGNPKYGLVAPSFQDIKDEMERALSISDWCSEGHGVYKKTEGDSLWHAKFEETTPSGRNFTRGFKTKATKRNLSRKFTSEDILKFDNFLD
ncbi:DNA-directed DNA polymerase [Tanacetum coccineum]